MRTRRLDISNGEEAAVEVDEGCKVKFLGLILPLFVVRFQAMSALFLPGSPILVRKLTPDRVETWRYAGEVLAFRGDRVILEALFNRADLPFLDLTLARGDRFTEAYFSDRWYNIYEIHDGRTSQLKGWYCNVSYPAEFSPGQVDYVDLALDLWVYPSGRQVILDEDQFTALVLSEPARIHARQALGELQHLARLDGLHSLLQLEPGSGVPDQ